ncbi:peptidase family C50-domain-containing protein [Gloeopeniophorella convolvens]|nr:peptidase family C50-domain-containing protein [Gloeopeniophorella convolvens]
MPAKVTTRRPVAAPTRQAAAKGRTPAAASTDELASQLASKLTVSKAKTTRSTAKRDAPDAPKTPQERRVSAMRSVNAASQGLGAVVKTGWKAPSEVPPTKKPAAAPHEAFGLATSARIALEELRGISPGDVDVERAAISIAGKLLGLDMTGEDYIKAEGKMKRALDRLRRAAVKTIASPKSKASNDSLVKAVKALLLDISATLEALLSPSSPSDDYASALDLSFVLARTTIVPNNPVTTDLAYDLLSRAARILGLQLVDNLEHSDSITSPSLVDEATFANFVRCLSGAFHTLGGILYQAGKYGTAIRFLRQGCVLGKVAVRLQDNCSSTQDATETKEADSWIQLNDQLSRRWELLGVCYSKIADRQGAYDSFVESLTSYVFPHAFVESVRTIGPAGAFEAFPALKQAAVIIDRVTYMATCELLRPASQVSLKRVIGSISINGAADLKEERLCVAGAILERQTESLAGNLWKASVQSVVSGLLSDCISIYDSETRPIRRAGATLKALELIYYAGGAEDAGLVASTAEVEALSDREALGLDLALAHLQALHSAEMHVWLALYAHRRGHQQQSTLIVQHAQEAYWILRSWVRSKNAETIEVVGAKKSVKQVGAARKAKGRTATARAVTATTRKPRTTKAAPVTPRRPQQSEMVQAPEPPPNGKAGGNGLLTLKDSRRLVTLLNMAIHLAGFVGHIILKLELLQVARQICEHHLLNQHEDFVRFSVTLAHEYVKLGKLKKAGSVYNRSLNSAQVQTVSDETKIVLLLRHAESVTRIGLLVNEKEMSTLDRVQLRVNFLQRTALAASVFAEIKLAEDDPTASLVALLQALRLWNRSVSTLSYLSPREGTATVASSSLAETLLAVAGAFFRRGSAREAEYFVREAEQLAGSMNAPALLGRALAVKGEVQLQLGQLDAAHGTLTEAADTLPDAPGPDAAELRRLFGEHDELLRQDQDAQLRYAEALRMLEELDKKFSVLDGSGRRSSIPLSSSFLPGRSFEPPAPTLFSAVLRQHIWLLRDNIGDDYENLLQKLSLVAPLSDVQAEERSLLAKLTLHDAYDHFREDMFLSSIRESVLSLPMGLSDDQSLLATPSAQTIMRTLTDAERLFYSNLTISARRGKVPRVREAASSLALIRSYQSSLGANDSSLLIANLLDACANITLRRELLEVISYKLPSFRTQDDLCWPLLNVTGEQPAAAKTRMKTLAPSPFDSDDDSEDGAEDLFLTEYWRYIREKYQRLPFDSADLLRSKVDRLPKNWTVVHICVTEDQNTLFVTRQRAEQQPLVFSLPLKGRRETEDDEHLAFEDAISELREIIRLSDESTKSAINVKGQDQGARAAWWADRGALDKRLKELLESIEFCWFGAFKKIFERAIGAQGKKQSTHMQLDGSLLECFSRLSPKCRDEELEDLVYFILDLCQFQGLQVAIAEVDIDHVVVDLRAALEEHTARVRDRAIQLEDEHVFLVLTRSLQEIPWESIPVLRGRSVSRIPNVDFLLDSLEFARRARGSGLPDAERYNGRTQLDAANAYYILNPSGDLKGTERRFSPWLKSMRTVGWDGIIGRAPSEQEFTSALTSHELLIYFGHGGGEQYIRSHKIRQLPRCAATMLWGCSSGLLRDMGMFDRIGTPYNYALAGCPTLVANLWDVTDRDIDKLTQAVFDKMHLTPEALKAKRKDSAKDGTSVVTALAEARDACKLKYITGAAPVIYGIPFYL